MDARVLRQIVVVKTVERTRAQTAVPCQALRLCEGDAKDADLRQRKRGVGPQGGKAVRRGVVVDGHLGEGCRGRRLAQFRLRLRGHGET